MGKTTTDQAPSQAVDPESTDCDGGIRWICRVFSLRCVVVLVLAVCVFLSAVFWLPPFDSFRSGGDRGKVAFAPIQASFILQKPVSYLSLHTEQLEYDIFNEIGVPDTKVAVISMNPSTEVNSTNVMFGVVPNFKHRKRRINPVILSVLRSSLIELVLMQSNLSLTQSIFGQPSSFQILKFPGGITVIPVQSAPIWQINQNLFNFTLNYNIMQIQKNLDELKGQLKYGLNLKYYENVYVQMTNLNGSTVEPPVIVEASVLSDVGSRNLLPPRLKQLAQTITWSSPTRNLGLNHKVFGKVKEVVLSSYLNHSIVSGSPSPSPSPGDEFPSTPPTVSVTPSPSHAPAPSNDHNNNPPCFCCNAPPPSGSPSPASSHDGWSHSPTSQPSELPLSPSVSPVAHSSVGRAHALSPQESRHSASPSRHTEAPAPSDDSSTTPSSSPEKPPGPASSLPRKLSPPPLKSPRPGRGGKSPSSPFSESAPMSPLSAATPIPLPSTSNFGSCFGLELWTLGLLLLFHLL